MINKAKIKEIFERYEYRCICEEKDYMVYEVGRNLYPGVEIICLTEIGTHKVEHLVKEFREQNYSVRVCEIKEVEELEDYLFDWFFQVERSNKKIKIRYEEYTSTVMRAYGIDTNQLCSAHYEYVRCPYSVEHDYKTDTFDHNTDIIKSLRNELEQTGARLVIVEAPAGYGKTSTSMELLNSYSNVKTGIRPFYMQLSKDREAPTFYYLLISQINKNFDVLLGDTIVMHNIKEGRIPLIIDGFDELLNEDLDKGSSNNDKKKGQTMLETIAALLERNAKIVLTTRKTAILSGEEFYNWYEQTVSDRKKFVIVRYKLEQPRIENWIDEKRMRILPNHIKDLSNPVLLGYLHFLNDEVFKQEAQSDALVRNYITRLLTREIERQQLPFSNIQEQRLIYERLASILAYGDITSDTRKSIKEYIMSFSSDIINKYATPMKDADNIANSLTNHVLLDRKGDNNIGFVNDFVLGLFIGYAIINNNESLRSYYEKMTTRFIDKVILAMSACEETERQYTCLQLQEQCINLTPNLRLFAEIKLFKETKSKFNETYLEGNIITSIKMEAPSSFIGCQFVNCDFVRGKIDFSIFTDCTFINCRFNQMDLLGKTDGVDFFECLKDGIIFDPNVEEILTSEEMRESTTQTMELEILKSYFPPSSMRRKMQTISRLKEGFADRRKFKKVFCSLVSNGYILTNGDQSHISDIGVEFLNKHQ